MLRKTVFLIFALLVALAVSPALAQSSMDTYTSLDGSLTLSYPHGWIPSEQPDGVDLVTSKDVIVGEARALRAGEGIFAFIVFTSDSPLFVGDKPEEKLQTFLDLTTAQTGTFEVDKAKNVTIGKYPGAFATGTTTRNGDDIELLFIQFDNGGYSLIYMETAPNSLTLIEPKMRSIAASLEYIPADARANLSNLAPITLQNAGNIKLLYTINPDPGNTMSVAISPDGQTIAAGSQNGDISLWDVQSLEQKPSPEKQLFGIQQVLFTPDGQYLIWAENDGRVHLWDIDSKEERLTKRHDEFIRYMAVSPDSQWLAYLSISYTQDNTRTPPSTLWLWNLKTDEEQNVADKSEGYSIASVAFSPDGKQLLYGGVLDNAIGVWLYDVANKREIDHWSGEGGLIDVVFTADSTPLVSKTAAVGNHDVLLWNPETDRVQLTLTGHQSIVYLTIFNHDRTILGTSSFDNTARLWNAETGEMLASLQHDYAVYALAFSSDGRLLVTADARGKVYVWGVAAKAKVSG